MNDERTALIAAMYQAEPKPAQRVETAIGKSRKLRVGSVEYTVPTVAYIETLERLVAMQGAELTRQKRLLARLFDDLSQMRASLLRQSHTKIRTEGP